MYLYAALYCGWWCAEALSVTLYLAGLQVEKRMGGARETIRKRGVAVCASAVPRDESEVAAAAAAGIEGHLGESGVIRVSLLTMWYIDTCSSGF